MRIAEIVRGAILAVVSGLCLVRGGVASAADSAALAEFKQAIRAKYDMKERAFHERDGETIVTKFYAEDVVSTGEGSPLHRGRDELRKLYQSPDVINNDVRIVSFDTHVNGDAGWDWADFHVTPADQTVAPFTFKILFLWEKVNGEWWCKGDMYVIDKSTPTATAGVATPR
jgi:ketosteroid isomerase-like protein